MTTINIHSTPLPMLALRSTSEAITIELERPRDVEAREALLDRAFGPARFRKTCQTLRSGRLPARGLSLVAKRNGDVVGTVRLWHVVAGGVPALMLGPLAVDDRLRSHGIGARLMEEALIRAKALGHEAILLVGDAPYYARFGFARRHTLNLRLPGPVEEDRFLGLEVRPDAFAQAKGLVRATGAIDLGAHDTHQRRRQITASNAVGLGFPPPCGEGSGVGVLSIFDRVSTARPPTSGLSPHGGEERIESGGERSTFFATLRELNRAG